MSAPYQPAWVNMPGQGMNGLAEDFTVSRMSPSGEMTQRQPNNPKTKGFYTSDNPASFVDLLIRREDFAPGPDGDAAYEAALANFVNGGDPNVANRTPNQQNVWDAQQANAATAQGGSSSLATISWATNHPDEALAALMALNPGTMGETGFLTDETIRDIVTGLGGIAAVNAMIAEERQNLINQGVIPAQGQSPAGNGSGWANWGGDSPGSPYGDTAAGGAQQPGWGRNWYGGQESPVPGIAEGFANPPQQSGQPGLNNPHDEAYVQDLVNGNTAPPTPPYPNQGPGMVGATRTPYQMGGNGEVVGNEPLPDSYQYSQVGQDVYLDVTDSYTGQVHRFSGDVVEAAYSSLGYGSFDEMVADPNIGYDKAVEILFGFIAPPPIPPRAGPVPAPTGGNNYQTPGGGAIPPSPGGGGGGGGLGGPAFTP